MATTDDMQQDRLLDYVYGELTEADAAAFERELQSSPQLKAELDAVERTRSAARAALPDAEPPVAIANMLLHEAAKQAAATSGGDKPGLWDRMLSWFEPLVAHPALSAAAAMVLFVAVVGTVGLSRVSREAAQAPGQAAEVALAGAEPERQVAKEAAPVLEEAGAEATEPSSTEVGYGALGDVADEADDADEGDAFAVDARRDLGGAAERRAADLATAKQEETLRRAEKGKRDAYDKKKSSGRNRKAARRRAVREPLLPVPQKVPPPATKSRSKSAGGVGQSAPARAPVPVAESESDIDDGVFADEAPEAAAPAQAVPAPSRPRAQQKRAPSAPPSAAVPAGAADGQARAAGASDPAARRRARNEQTLAQLRAVAKKTRDSTRRCREVARLANDLRDRDPAFYKKRVASDAAVRRCNSAVAAETTRRARARRAKASDAAQAADAAEAETAPASDKD